MPSTLPYYWQLASASTADRLSSSRSLVETLISQQKAAGVEPIVSPRKFNLPSDGADTSSAVFIDGKSVEEAESLLDAHNSTEVTYAIRRLMKGLASHRESSRLGFSVALCELISQLKSIPAHHMIVLILSYSSPTGKVKGQEERDLMFARLFGLYAIIRSGLLSDAEMSLEQDFKRVVEIVWLLGKSKIWLRESSGWIIVEVVRSISSSDVSWKEDCLRWLASKICEAKEIGPESVAIYLAIRTTSVSLVSSKVLPSLTSTDLLTSANLVSLARILKEGVKAEETSSISSGGFVQTQVHFVWDLLLQQYTETGASGDDNKAPLSEMYRVLVDEALFGSSASDQKKSWGFQIFEKAVQIVAEDDLPHIFTTNFMRTWTNQLADRNRMLHKSALRCVTTIQDAVKHRPNIGKPIINQLINRQCTSSFPAKVVESILASMTSSDGLLQYVNYLFESACLLINEGSDSTRRWALDQLSSVVRNASLPTDDNCITSILSFLAANGFFTTKAALNVQVLKVHHLSTLPQPGFSNSVKSICRIRFFSCLGEVCDQSAAFTDTQGKVKRRQGLMTSGQSWVSKAFDIVEGLENDKKHFIALYPREKDDATSRGLEFRRKLSKASQKNVTEERKYKMQDFESMLLAGMLYSQKDLSRKEEVDSGLIDSMIECGNRLVLEKKAKEGEPSAMELFIHCVVSYLEHPSAFLRSTATQAFAAFSDELNREGLEQIINQLGFNEDQAEEEVDEEDADEEEEKVDEDEDEDVLSDSISETSATSVSSTKDEAVDPVFVAKLQEVLKAGGVADSDADSSDDEEASSSSASQTSDFNDDQMMLIDDKLADIFRQKLGTRKEEEEAKKGIVTLHIKLLDLLDIFARKQSSSELCVEMVLPLFTIALEKDAALGQLKQRAVTVLQKTLCKSKEGPNGTLIADAVFKPMEAVHKMAATKLPTPSLNLCSSVNIYLTKACQEQGQLDGKIRDLYLSTLNDFIQRKSNNLKPEFLIDTFQRSPLLGFSLRNELLEAASRRQESAKDSYRQLQALDMLRISLVSLANTGKGREDLITFLPRVSQAILQIVSNEKLRLKEIMKVGLDLARLSKRICNSQADLEQIWSPLKINKVIEEIGQGSKLPNSTSVQALLRQLLAIIGEQSAKKSNSKRKGGDDNDINASKKDKKQRKAVA